MADICTHFYARVRAQLLRLGKAMAQELTVGQLMLRNILPSDVYSGEVLDKKGLQEVMARVAKFHPEKYEDISHNLVTLGLRVGEQTGGASFDLNDIKSSKSGLAREQTIRAQMRQILDTSQGEDRMRRIRDLLEVESANQTRDVLAESEAENNSFARQLKGAGRGSPGALTSMRSGNVAVADATGRTVPIPITRGFSSGLTPMQYLGASYGARLGLATTKLGVGQGGFLCFAGETLVRMADGSTKRIDQIMPGDWVLGANKDGQTMPVQVLNRWDNGYQSAVQYDFSINSQRGVSFSVIATPGHEVLAAADAYYRSRFRKSNPQSQVSNGALLKVQLGHCKRRKHRLYLNGPAVEWGGQRAEPFAWLYGFCLGDGCNSSGKANFATADSDVLQTVSNIVEPFGLQVRPARTTRSDFEYAIRAFRLGEPWRLNVFSTRLRQLGHLGKTAEHKFIHEEVWSWDKESICQMLSGLFEADGCVSLTASNTITISLTMGAARVVKMAHELLSVVLGVHSTQPKKFKPGKTASRPSAKMPAIPQARIPMWSISITGYENVSRFVSQLPARGVKLKLAHRLLTELGYPRKFPVTASVRLEQPLGECPVFDLEVDHPDHMYVLACGLVVSNSKLLQQAGHRIVVTADDDDRPIGRKRGLLVETDDHSNIGALLADDYGPFPRNTPITPRIQAALRKMGLGEILVRSPITGSSVQGGVYAKDAGLRENGQLAAIGDSIGQQASQAIGEIATQQKLGAKHVGGRLGAKSGTPGLQGFDLVEKLTNLSENNRGFATHAQADGVVRSIREAPQGGKYVQIGEDEHYVAPGFEVTVKPGQSIEAGLPISNGVPNPAMVLKHRGIGEGRHYMVNSLRQALGRDKVDRRQLELLATGLIDRVRFSEEYEDFLPDDVVPYSRVERMYTPREDSEERSPTAANNYYLEEPVAHYSIGTRVTPSIAATMSKLKIPAVRVHKNPTPFQPEVTRGLDLLSSDPDWMTRFLGSNLKKSFLSAVHYGAESDEEGTSFVPSRARAVDFGRLPLQQGVPLTGD